MTVYQPGDVHADLLLINWYMEMGQCDDFERTFSAVLAPAGSFLSEMQRTLLVYETDDKGIWLAVWFDRVMAAGAFGLWVRSDKRHTAVALRNILHAVDFGLERFPVLLFVTRDATVTSIAERLGFTVLGDIPWLFDGEAATVAWIDRAHFTPVAERFKLADEHPDG